VHPTAEGSLERALVLRDLGSDRFDDLGRQVVEQRLDDVGEVRRQFTPWF